MTELSSVQQWSYPFNLKGEEGQSSKPVTDPLQYFDALAKAKGGYYPIGKNGLWHGGVHFDSGTAASLDQSAIRCIADGEVVAYRIDDTYKKSNFSSGEKLFSTGFVLVRHKLELPKLDEQANATNIPAEQPSLIFYSLYMHLLDWAGYTKENAPTPPNFLNKAVYTVKADKATDVVKGLRVRTAPRSGQVKAVLPKGTRVKLGEQSATNNKWYRLISILEGQALPAINLDEECWVFEGQLDNTDTSDERLVGVKANDTEPTLAPQKGLNIRKAATGSDKNLLTGLIPVDVTFTLETDTGRYCKIKEFISGQNILPLKEDCIKNISGYVYKECLQASRTPPTLNDIHVLDSPYPIRAGEIIGHLGIYQNHDDIAVEPMLHLEVFSCEDVPAFIEKTKAAAASLPDEKKNLLKIHKGASKLISHRSDISASNPPKLSDAGTVIGVDMIFNLEVLNNYPQDRKITVTETLPGSTTSKTRTWWRLDNILADKDGNRISGWLTEQSELTTRHSPWEWEGFNFISETPSNLDHLACHFDNSGQLDDSERSDYAARIELSDNGPIKERLYNIIDIDSDKKLTPKEIKISLALPWSAQSISFLLTYYESEWFFSNEKWSVLNEIIYEEELNNDWEIEKIRIEICSWWQSLARKFNFPQNAKIWHIHLHSLLANFSSKQSPVVRAGMVTFVAEGNDIPGSPWFSRSIHWPGNELSGVTLGRGYDMGSRSQVEIYNHMISAGIDHEQANKISLAHGKTGNSANEFVSEYKSDIGTITMDQQINLFNVIYPDYLERARKNYNTWTAYEVERTPWENLDIAIREILVDFVYQGFTKGPAPMKAGMLNNRDILIHYIENNQTMRQYEPARHRANYLRNYGNNRNE